MTEGRLERELIEQARRGDRTAYEAIVRRKVETVYRTARAILGNDADADDATQEALIGAWRQMPTLRDVDRFDAWLGRITVNACRMALRRRRSNAVLPLPGSTLGGAADPPDPITSTFDSQSVTADAFDRAFDRLPIEQRAILVLHHREELLIEEIAGRLGIPAGTVKSRLHTARIALQRALEREGIR